MPVLLEKKNTRCGKCNRLTPHVYVRNNDTKYWRCEICVMNAINYGKIFIPRYLGKRPYYKGFDSLDFNDQMNKFRKRV